MIFGYYDNETFPGYIPNQWNRRGSLGEPGNVLVVDGDSFYVGQGGPNLAMMLGRRFDIGWGRYEVLWYNAALAGNTWSNMVLQGPTAVDAYYNPAPGSVNLLVCGEWINQVLLGGATIAQTATHAANYYTARKAIGWYVYNWINQVTQYQDDADPEFQEWENADPTFANNSRWHADNVMITTPSSYLDNFLDTRDGGVYESQFYTANAYSRWPELFVGGGTPAGQSHVNNRGLARKADFCQPRLATAYGLPAATSLYDSQWANWPLWSESGTTNFDYWVVGTNNLVQAGSVTQNALSITLGSTLFSTYLSTTTSGGAETAHTLHAINSFSWGGWINISSVAAIPTNLAAIGGVPGEYRAWIDQAANKYKYTVYEDAGGTNVVVQSANTPATGWHFFYYEVDGGNIGISVDNETLVTGAITTVYGGSANQFQLGYDSLAWKGIPGDYRTWFWYNRKLTTTERTYLYNSGTPRLNLFV